MSFDRLNHVVSVLETHKKSLIEYFSTKDIQFSDNDYSANRYANKEVLYYDYLIPNLDIDHEILKEIASYSYVTFINYSAFLPGMHLFRHVDPSPADKNYQQLHLHREFFGDPDYRRVHLPIVDSTDDCYMIFDGEKYSWKRGEIQIFNVNKFRHEVFNQSDQTFYLLMIDVLVGKE